MSRPAWKRFIALLATFLLALAGLVVAGCGDNASEQAAPGWVLQLPDGAAHGAWSPDGGVFALPAHDRIELIDTDGDLVRRIDVSGIDNSGLSCECRVGWSADGAAIHIVTRPRPRARGGVATVGADGGNLRSRYLDLHASEAAWSPRGWPLVLVPAETADGPAQRTPSRPLLALERLHGPLGDLLKGRGEIRAPAFSPDGKTIAFSADAGRGSGLWIVAAGGGRPHLLLAGLRDAYASWSPEGGKLAVSTIRPSRGQRRQILLVNLDGDVRSLPAEPAVAESPAWKPNGRWIAYADEEGSVNEVRSDGAGRRRLFQLPGEEVFGLSWSPDGRHLALTSQPITPIS